MTAPAEKKPRSRFETDPDFMDTVLREATSKAASDSRNAAYKWLRNFLTPREFDRFLQEHPQFNSFNRDAADDAEARVAEMYSNLDALRYAGILTGDVTTSAAVPSRMSNHLDDQLARVRAEQRAQHERNKIELDRRMRGLDVDEEETVPVSYIPTSSGSTSTVSSTATSIPAHTATAAKSTASTASTSTAFTSTKVATPVKVAAPKPVPKPTPVTGWDARSLFKKVCSDLHWAVDFEADLAPTPPTWDPPVGFGDSMIHPDAFEELDKALRAIPGPLLAEMYFERLTTRARFAAIHHGRPATDDSREPTATSYRRVPLTWRVDSDTAMVADEIDFTLPPTEYRRLWRTRHRPYTLLGLWDEPEGGKLLRLVPLAQPIEVAAADGDRPLTLHPRVRVPTGDDLARSFAGTGR